VTATDGFGIEHRLATYGTLAPGRTNEHILAELDGTWTLGTVRGHLFERGWGAADGYPGIVLDDSGPHVEVHVFTSSHLPAHWDNLDHFEGPGYRRNPVVVRRGDVEIDAYIYALADDAIPRDDVGV
jgi:gamma-glutamylcyclotransferase (GGCT)/AIG2-like uncharacterized protein YtfP